MKNFDPRVKLLGIFIVTSFAILIKNPLELFFLSIFTVLISILFHADFKLLFGKLKRVISLLCGLTFVQVFFVRTGTVLLEIANVVFIYSDGLERALIAGMRLFILLCSASIMAAENSRHTIASLSKIGIPYKFSCMIMLSMRFIPFFMESFSDAITAMQLRGIELKKITIGKKITLFSHILSPIVADAILKSQNLAIAMESRGFGARKKRTSFIQLKLHIKDWIVIICLIAISALALWFYF